MRKRRVINKFWEFGFTRESAETMRGEQAQRTRSQTNGEKEFGISFWWAAAAGLLCDTVLSRISFDSKECFFECNEKLAIVLYGTVFVDGSALSQIPNPLGFALLTGFSPEWIAECFARETGEKFIIVFKLRNLFRISGETTLKINLPRGEVTIFEQVIYSVFSQHFGNRSPFSLLMLYLLSKSMYVIERRWVL